MLIFLFSCKDSDKANISGISDTSDNSDNADNNADGEASVNPLYIDDLPERNFNGEKFNMLTWEYIYSNTELVVEEQTGDVVYDSIYLSNRIVQDRFNVEFEQMYANSYDGISEHVKKAVNAGDNLYDFVLMLDRNAIALAMEGKYFYNMGELPYVNLDKLYWDQELKKIMTINNVLYFTYGANMLAAYDSMNFMVYNKQIASELGIENIYDLVRGGKWTIDKLYEMAAAAAKDLDGDGKMTKNDRWGVALFSGWYYPSFWVGEKIPLVGKNEDDLPYFNVPGNEKLFDIFEKLYAYAVSGFEYTDNNDFRQVFDNGLSLFMSSTTFDVQRLRAMETDYGIIPYPTFAEKTPGEPYVGRIAYGYPLTVPVTADVERASVIMEALACEYQKRVIPNYFDIAVKTKSTRDEESIEILNMLMSNRYMDYGDSLWTYEVRVKYTDIFDFKTNNFQSVTEKITGNVEKTLAKAIETFGDAKSG